MYVTNPYLVYLIWHCVYQDCVYVLLVLVRFTFLYNTMQAALCTERHFLLFWIVISQPQDDNDHDVYTKNLHILTQLYANALSLSLSLSDPKINLSHCLFVFFCPTRECFLQM